MRKVIRGCNWVVVKGESLNLCRNNIVNIIVDSNKSSIIKGNVYAADGSPCLRATIEVDEINPYNNERKVLGYAVTDKNGEYQFSVNPIYYMTYEIKVYSPLKISRRESVCGE